MISNLTVFSALAWAGDVTQDAAAQQGNPIMTFLPLIAIFAVMYFLMIRPQSKKAKAHQAMLNSLKKDDRVQTSGGILGRVTGLDQQEITLEIAPQIRIKVVRGAVARVIGGGGDGGAVKK